MKYQLLTVLVVGIVLAWVYILFVREWLVSRWPEKFLWWHLIEDKLWRNSRTILVGRLYWIAGIIIAAHDTMAEQGFDWTPFTSQINQFFPEPYRPLVLPTLLVLTGLAINFLRKRTTQPLEQKPVV